jgi:ferredoxin--NADP+ reductase
MTNASEMNVAYDLVVIGGSSGGLSVAVSSLRSGLGLVRIVEPGNSVVFPSLVAENQLDIGLGETVQSIELLQREGFEDRLVVTTNRLSYLTRACVVAQRPPLEGWTPDIAVSIEHRIHIDDVSAVHEGDDVLVIGTTDNAIELMAAAVDAGARVVLAAKGLDPARLSPGADNVLRRHERGRRATVLYRNAPDGIGEIEGFPMAFFDDRRTPDLQFDHVVFASPRQTESAEAVGLTDEAAASGKVWFLGEPTGNETVPTSPGWRLGVDLAEANFPELEAAVPDPHKLRRRHEGAQEELRALYYNATITHFEPTHSDLWTLRVRPDDGDTSFVPGQYATLGLGHWEHRIDDAIDPGIEDKWEKLIRRSYSISSRMLDDSGYLTDEPANDELEFYIVLVKPTPDNVPGLTPRLAMKRPGDRIYLGPKVAGRYTLHAVNDPSMTVVFLSTGTGEAPHNAMLIDLLRKGHSGPIVSAVSVRRWDDLGYLEKHRGLEARYPNYHYLPLPTREDDVPKRYIQDVLANDGFAEAFGVQLDPANTHVFLCGNPAMIGLAEKDENGNEHFPETKGAVEILLEKGFTVDQRTAPGNVHYEEYW